MENALEWKLDVRSNADPVSLLYPIAFIGGVLFVCAWALHGDRLFAQIPHPEHEISDDLKKH